MVRSFMRVVRTSAIFGAFSLLTAFGVGCSSNTSTPNPTDNYASDCNTCRKEGDSCKFSINCPAGNICNDPIEDLYDASKAKGVCAKVVCANDSDCTAPKKCGLEKICNAPVCQADSECSGGTSCISGACKAAPGVMDVSTCTLATRSQSLLQGKSVTLLAIAKNATGVVIPKVGFDWTSSNTNVAAISVTSDGLKVATGGTQGGTTQITAAVTGKASVTCSGTVITNFPTLAANMSRVVVAADDTGAPIDGAQVTIFAPGMMTAMTDATGAATFTTGAALQSVTVTKTGWQYLTVLAPGTNDIFLPVPKMPDQTKAGGFRGAVDLSKTRRADIQIGIAGPSIPQNLLDFGLASLLGDSVKTTINAPELGLSNQVVNLPGGILLGLGNKRFTADYAEPGGGLRCNRQVPTDTQLGCYVARAPAGLGAAWVLAGQLKLSRVTSIATQLSSALGGGGTSNLPLGDILTAVLPLLRSLNHGIRAAVAVTEYPKVPVTAGTNCMDPTLDKYDEKCRGDFSQYANVDLAADQPLNVLSTVTVPTLPTLPNGMGCAGAAILVSGAILPGRGLLPLGLTAGLKKDMSTSCQVEGVKKPFGDNSPQLMDGQIPLSMAPPHSGVEGSQLLMLLLALDPKTITGSNLQLNAIVKRKSSIGLNENLSSDAYLPYPKGTLSRAGKKMTLMTAGIAGATATRLQIEKGNQTWLVYAPATQMEIAAPDIAAASDVFTTSEKSFVQAIKVAAPFKDLWTFGSGKTADHLVEQLDAFVVQECSTMADATCKVQ